MHWFIGFAIFVLLFFGYLGWGLIYGAGIRSQWEEDFENRPPSAPAINEDAAVERFRLVRPPRDPGGNAHQRKVRRRAAQRAKLTAA